MAAIPPAVTSPAGYGVGQGQQTVLQHNSSRLVNLARVLATCMHPDAGRPCESFQLFKLFVSLARGIDYAVANSDVPVKSEELPVLLKQICQPKNDSLLQAAIMVLMLSVKNACKVGWFSENETQELLNLADEVGSFFCNPGVVNSAINNTQANIAEIMLRYYPLMKMGNILAFLEAKPGYATSIIDFHISKNTVHSPEEKIRLFVAQVDNMETSACIVNPQQVNFLLNGKGVDKRTNVFMDTGPQLPTNVSAMLKYGTNLLQAVGQFYGHYIIVVAYMSVVSPPDAPVLPDYVQSGNLAPETDSELIEGPSRITLRCPISRTRIKTPVKGIACKHLQCFDFENYVDINTRRPSWRCPHCNQHVCYTDLRVVQNMVKVLREVAEDISEVIISAEGSWKAVLENNDQADHAKDQIHTKDGFQQEEPVIVSNAAPSVFDLTLDETEMMQVDAVGTGDRKPAVDELQNQSTAINSDSNSAVGSNQDTPPWMQDDFWSGLISSTALIPIASSSPQTAVASSTPAENTQIQQSQPVNSNTNPEHGRIHPPFRQQIIRVPNAVQALPARPQTTPALPQTTRTTANGPTRVPSELLRQQQQVSRPHPTTVLPSHNHLAAQKQNQNSRPSLPGVPATMQQRNQQLAQQRVAQMKNNPPGPSLPRPQSPQGSVQPSQAALDLAAANRAAHRATMRAHPRTLEAARTSTTPAVEQRGPQTAVPSSVATAETSTDQGPRPAARMRGSLSGKQYSSALSHLMIQPTQSPQGSKPSTNVTSPPNAPPRNLPPGLQQILGGGRTFRSPPTPNSASTTTAGITGSSSAPTTSTTTNSPAPAATSGNSGSLPEKPGGTR